MEIPGNRKQVRLDRFHPRLGCGSPRAHEGFGGDVLRVVRVAGEPVSETIDILGVALVELMESRRSSHTDIIPKCRKSYRPQACRFQRHDRGSSPLPARVIEHYGLAHV